MQDLESFNLFKVMLNDGYNVEEIKKLIGLSEDEVELYLGLLGYKDNVVDFKQYNDEAEKLKKAI